MSWISSVLQLLLPLVSLCPFSGCICILESLQLEGSYVGDLLYSYPGVVSSHIDSELGSVTCFSQWDTSKHDANRGLISKCFCLPLFLTQLQCHTEVYAILWREIRWRNQHMERETNHLDGWVRPFWTFLFSPVTHARMVPEQKDLCSVWIPDPQILKQMKMVVIWSH